MEQQFFGTVEQRAVARQAAALWQLVSDDPRFASHGRTIGLNGQFTTDLDLLLALTRLQGVATIDGLPNAQLGTMIRALQDRNLTHDLYVHWVSDQNAVEISQRYLDTHALPDDVTLLTIDATTPLTRLHQISGLLEG